MQVSWAARTDPGRHRSQNEDCYTASSALGLFVVADGMGGHAAGEIASEVAVTEIEKVIEATSDRRAENSWPIIFDGAASTDENRLKAAFDLANQRITQQVENSEELRGMATTAVALLIRGNEATLAHVGDSRAYLYREHQLKRLTSDHSWVEEQMRAGRLTPSAAREHPWRNLVTRSLSGSSGLAVEMHQFDLYSLDRLLLCSDGLSVVLDDREIEGVVGTIADRQKGCDELILRANQAGGPDNITALLIDVLSYD